MTAIGQPTAQTGTAINSGESQLLHPPWWIFATTIIIGGAAALSYGAFGPTGRVAVLELLLAEASLSVGGLMGFLFGIPRTGQRPPTPAVTHSAHPIAQQGRGMAPRTELPVSSDQSIGYQPSTNLEQIADWLTKIIIGVGLVQFSSIGGALREMGQYVSAQLGDAGSGGAAIVTEVVLILFVVVGFLLSFLWTRIYYGEIQTRADRGILQLLVGVSKKLDEQEVKSVVTEKVARAALTSQKVVTPSREQVSAKGLRKGGAKQQDDAWPDDVRERVRKFEASPPEWDSNPGEDLFAPIARNPFGRVWDVSDPIVVDESLIFTFRVHGSAGKMIGGPVTFLLHPTYSEPRRTVPPDSHGVAELTIAVDGWFTAVAIADEGQTVMLMRLRDVPRVPAWFKKD